MTRKKIIAVDPGGTTGLAYLNCEWPLTIITPVDWNFRTFQEEHHNELHYFISMMNPDVLLWEQFTIDPNMSLIDAKALEYIGVMQLWLQERKNRQPPTQSISYPSAKVKGFWTDAKLQRIGLYKTGSRHTRDAVRQILTYLSDRRQYYYVNQLRRRTQGG